MIKDNQRLIINRIVEYLIDGVEGKNVTNEFFKMYKPEGESNIKNMKRSILNYDQPNPKKTFSILKEDKGLGLPNLGNNVMKGDKIKDEYNSESVKTTEVTIEEPVLDSEGNPKIDKETGKPITVKKTTEESMKIEEPNNKAMSEITNRATAITHAFAILQELIPIYDTLDEYKKKIEELESKVSKLESEVKKLK